MSPWWHSSPALTEADRALIDRAMADPRYAAGIPGERDALARRRARALVDDVTAACPPEVIRHSVIGPEWSNDLDLYWTRPPDDDMFVAAGWRPLADVLQRLGRIRSRRWAIVDGDDVVGAADIVQMPPPPPLSSVLRRARNGPTTRLVLELRALQRSGQRLPPLPELARVGKLERRLGGAELASEPVPLRRRAESLLHSAAVHRPRRRRPRVVIAVSGVDGAGKSSVITRFSSELALAGVPFTVLWARPGHDLGWLGTLAQFGKRVLGHQPEPGLRAIGAGDAARPPSRRGVAGRLWSRLVVLDYVVRARRAATRADGVVIHDRHAVDAAVTLAFAYELDGPWVLPLMRFAMPEPDVHVYLDIDAATASRRKPHDSMRQAAIADQIERYGRVLPRFPGVMKLDATEPPSVLSDRLWAMLLDTGM